MNGPYARGSFGKRLIRDLKRNSGAYLMLLPTIILFLLFRYKPMCGIVIAFKNYRPGKEIFECDWVGLKHFVSFFNSYYFTRLIKNTVVIGISSLIFSFPMPIIFALLLNEVKNDKFKRVVQTVTYMPHFISLVVMCGLIKQFTSSSGIITQLMNLFGYEGGALLGHEEYFVPIYVISGIWQGMGWSSIVYLSALAGIDPGLYEAASIDGANRWQLVRHITLPGIRNTIIVMLLLQMGSVFNVGYEKVMLLYNESIYKTADVISTFVYRKGLEQMQFSYSTAVGLFNSLLNFIIVIVFNKISRKVNETSLW